MNEPWKQRFDLNALRDAVVMTFDYVQSNPDLGLPGAGSDDWTANHAWLEAQAMPRVIAYWCRITMCPPEYFPYTADAVAFTWVTWRKVPCTPDPRHPHRVLRSDLRKQWGLPPCNDVTRPRRRAAGANGHPHVAMFDEDE